MNKKTFKPDDCCVLLRHYDPHADAWLVLGKVKPEFPSLKKYAVFWQPRHEPEKIGRPRFFMDIKSARRAVRDMENAGEYEGFPHLRKDWQKKDVYQWEDRFVSRDSKTISEEEAKKIIRKVCKDYKVPTPKLIWEKKTEHSEYDETENAIYFGARDTMSLLHELAHCITDNSVHTDLLPDHSPAFVWLEIELLHKYAGFDLGYLVRSAAPFGILGDIETPAPAVNPVARKDRKFRL